MNVGCIGKGSIWSTQKSSPEGEEGSQLISAKFGTMW